MSIGGRAVEILQHAENSLRTLVGEAAANGDYENVLPLASWAQAIRDLIKTAVGRLNPGGNREESEQVRVKDPKRSSTQLPVRRVNPRKAYPRFFRQGDQLVKVAWSKREKKEYQHKAGFTVLMALSSALAKMGADGRVLSTDRFVPLKNPADDTEFPTYQVYVCLALLKHVGLVDQHGRQGYSIPQLLEFAKAVEGAWRQLPEH
jgi:hypothetical protein